MKTRLDIPPTHPRAASLRLRQMLVEHHREGVVATEGLIAHGRGEAFDYLMGEHTTPPATRATRAAAAALLLAKHPVISVNGNTAALVPRTVAKLATACNAKIEVNLFYGREQRESIVKRFMEDNGATNVFGCDPDYHARIEELQSSRRTVDTRGILLADVVLVPLEDGDRAEALRKLGKTVIAIDLNPLSRTAKTANITICDNIIRAIPNLTRHVTRMNRLKRGDLQKIVDVFDNEENLTATVETITRSLSRHNRRAATMVKASGE